MLRMKMFLLLVGCVASLSGMEEGPTEEASGKEELDGPPLRAAAAQQRGFFSRLVSRISPFSIDYERLAASIQPMISDAVRNGSRAITRGLHGALSDFANRFNTGFRSALKQGIGGSVKVGIDHLSEALKEGGELQMRLNGFIQRTVQRNLCISGTIVVLTVAGSAFAYYGTRTGWRMVERNMMRPKLIIASSQKTMLERIRERLSSNTKPAAVVFEMICSKELESRLSDLVRATRNIYKKLDAGAANVTYRNLMLWGPPGTGKTMFAKCLARESGLEWAYMSGSSFAKFADGEGIQALDELFAWANQSKGLMIFIDEAEAFLAQREQMDINSKAYQLLTNFLNHTGERSGKFMLVFATNHKHMIDAAMHRRIDDLIEMPLPAAPERFRVLELYCNKILFDLHHNGALFVDAARLCMEETKLQEIAVQTAGLSNADLEGIINIIKTDADITDTGLVTPQVVDRAVRRAMEKYAAFGAQEGKRKVVLYDELWRSKI